MQRPFLPSNPVSSTTADSHNEVLKSQEPSIKLQADGNECSRVFELKEEVAGFSEPWQGFGTVVKIWTVGRSKLSPLGLSSLERAVISRLVTVVSPILVTGGRIGAPEFVGP
jgi:hypothetical protein